MKQQSFMTVGQLKKACSEYPYLLLRFKSGHKMGVNSKVMKIAVKIKDFEDSSLTQFVSFHPCGFIEYIQYKHKFM